MNLPLSPGDGYLRTDQLVKRFDGVAAVDDVSLSIHKGEIFALLGSSGCGKSTLLRMLAGFETPTSGAVILDGVDIASFAPYERPINMMFQSYALFPHLNIWDNIAFGLKREGMPKAQVKARVEEMLQLVQLESFAKRKPHQLSGGQQQRVAIARAIVIEPPLILMDEPLSNLDAKLRIEMRSEIRRIHRAQGCSTVYVTHDQDEALAMADRIVVMKLGVVQQIGTPQDVFARPATLDIARFMGYRNVLPVRVAQADGAALTLEGPGGIKLAGTAMHALTSGAAMAAIRPDELLIGEGPQAFPGVVETAEYGGREWLLQVRTSFDDLLYVRSSRAVVPGDHVMLSAPAERVLVYAGES
jgi:ABC-type Fe3+/spermidine/putrescine transport system ATPase subunit